ncbi:MAG: peptidylprolyl isomerase [Candidatus Andersenbacteria bacterium]|nr:peptidylprolyl isomerase [Candidatus Andersenbacteria bacterium]
MQQETSQPSAIPSASAEASSIPTTGAPQVTFHTTKGDIVIELYPDKAPVTVANFLKLASAGFYNGVKFHRVIPNFMIQAGDPNTKGDDVSSYGMGGPGYTIDDEFSNGLSNTRGTIAMANTGAPHSGGSQFFINVKDNSASLDGGYSVFGKVLSGMDVADAIVSVPRNANDMPNDPITITSVEVK